MIGHGGYVPTTVVAVEVVVLVLSWSKRVSYRGSCGHRRRRQVHAAAPAMIVVVVANVVVVVVIVFVVVVVVVVVAIVFVVVVEFVIVIVVFVVVFVVGGRVQILCLCLHRCLFSCQRKQTSARSLCRAP